MADHLEQQTAVHRGLTRKKGVLFVGLLLLIGTSGLLSFAAINGLVKFPSVAIAPRDLTAIATAAARAYTAGTTKTGVMDRFDPAHTNWNPYEKVLNTTNVPGLVPLWSYDTGFSHLGSSSPTIANGIIYMSFGKLYAFDANCHKACQPLWSYDIGSITTSSPAVANGIVYVGSEAGGTGKLYAFDASCRSACQPLWSYSMGDTVTTVGEEVSSPTVTNGSVYIGIRANGGAVGNLYAFDASCRSACQPLWSYPTDGPIDSSPAVANGIVYIHSEAGTLYAFDASCRKACQPLWSYPTNGSTIRVSPVVVANGIVYIASLGDLGVGGKLYAFDASCHKACQPLWSYTTDGYIYSSPAVANGIVYIYSGAGKLSTFDANCRSACQPLWSYTIGNATGFAHSTIAIANGIIYVGSWDEKLYAFDANCRSACQPLWSYTTGNATGFSSLAVANGVVYVSAWGGKLYAFGLAVK